MNQQGWNLLGNLLDLGKVAFSPASPDVLKFAAYMEEKYGAFFTDNFHGVFASEVWSQLLPAPPLLLGPSNGLACLWCNCTAPVDWSPLLKLRLGCH